MSQPDAGTDTTDELPADIAALIGVAQYDAVGDFPVERGYTWTSAASVENGNPLFWDDAVADALTGGPIAVPTLLSAWFRPHHWSPDRGEGLALQVHFDLKERLGLPEAIMSDNTITFHEPVRPGDLLRTRQILTSVSGPKTTKLGTGRFWVIDVEYLNQRDELVGVESYTGFGYKRPTATESTADADGEGSEGPPAADAADAAGPGVARLTLADVSVGDVVPELAYPVSATTVVLGALAARDWRPMHHDHDFAVNRNGTQDIFLNTPNQAAWFERFITDWTGPTGRLGRMTFRMKGSVFPGDLMVMAGTVTSVDTDDTGCGWIGLDIAVTVDDDIKTTCTARVAVPTTDDDNPWTRKADQWKP